MCCGLLYDLFSFSSRSDPHPPSHPIPHLASPIPHATFYTYVPKECLRIAFATDMPCVQTHLLTAVAASACRISADAITSIHQEALSAVEGSESQAVTAEGRLVGVKLLRLIAEESSRKAVSESARPVAQSLAPATLSALVTAVNVEGWGAAAAAAVGGGAGGNGGQEMVNPKMAIAGWECLQQWIAAAGITVEDAASVPGLLGAICDTLDSIVVGDGGGGQGPLSLSSHALADTLADAVAAFLPVVGPNNTDALAPLLEVADAVARQRERMCFNDNGRVQVR